MPSAWTEERRNALADKFHACDPSALEWAEEFAVAAVKEQVDVGQAIAQQMSGTLTWLLGATFGAAAYSAKLWESPEAASPLTWAVGVASLYLMFLCAVIVVHGMNFRPAPSSYNVPSNLLHLDATADAHRPGELVLLEERIETLRDLNHRRAQLLNWARAAAVCTPLLLLLTLMAVSSLRQ